MAPQDILFTRCASNSSAGLFTSGKGARGTPLTREDLLAEFRSHMVLGEKRPLTALVSVSDRIVDTLSRALSKCRKGESADQIWIAFIGVPNSETSIYHHAEVLAEELEERNPGRFRHEYVFEWIIPEGYILHQVSLQTLINRGFNIGRYINDDTATLKQNIAMDYLYPPEDGYGIGLSLGPMARCFGARAPQREIIDRIIHECSYVLSVSHMGHYARVRYGSRDGPEHTVDFGYFCDQERGIDQALEWWLADSELCLDLKRHNEWVNDMEYYMEQEWSHYCIDVYEDAGSGLNPVFVTRRQEIEKRHEDIRAEIELAATELGL
ncbi:predicted protein [Paecilomyces variotii No. 5]|uniref:DUF7587 domain-containing protein n=1 Tax=Byssochlamys spectabilis (strain No. 5 / NBRC 109023) TaxID=1356009 RepID=V5G3G2_BYSSN|nr:predicted protein [Paecilomyces variotii No. 5]